MQDRKAQKEIERMMCKDMKYATVHEHTLDTNRKLIIQATKSKGCFDEVAYTTRKRAKLEKQKREEAQLLERQMRQELSQKRKIEMTKFGIEMGMLT